MALNLPEVQSVSLELKLESGLRSAPRDVTDDYVTDDYVTPNLFFLYYVPFLPDEVKSDLDAIQDEVYSWNAWELAQAEIQVHRHVVSGRLPGDGSLTSCQTRTNFRSKAISVFRSESQAWLSIMSVKTVGGTIETTLSEFHGSVLKYLRSIVRDNGLQRQFGVLINVISINIDPEHDHKFFFTHVYFKYDQGGKRFIPDISDTTFTIKIVKPKGVSQAGDANLKVEVSVNITSYSLDRELWKQTRHGGEEVIKLGELIRKEMAFDFFINT